MTTACVRCGYCCKKAPCPHGEWDREANQCSYLIGDRPGAYACGIYNYIIERPGSDIAPAFGAGCCSTMNTDRIEARRNHGK